MELERFKDKRSYFITVIKVYKGTQKIPQCTLLYTLFVRRLLLSDILRIDKILVPQSSIETQVQVGG